MTVAILERIVESERAKLVSLIYSSQFWKRETF
jgi:hypothetical protein